MEVLRLYDIARQHNISVVECPLPQNGSLSIMDENGKCYIGIDESVLDGDALERVHMGHELGHCETGSFYNIHSPFDLRERHEYKANKRSYQILIPHAELKAAVKKGLTEIWELAEYFDVPCEYMQKAAEYWRQVEMAG